MREYIFKAQYRGVGFTTIEVSDELRRGVKAGYEHLAPARQQIETVNPEGWLRILTPSSADEHRLRKALDRSLDPGEAWCLALAASRGLILATDDLAVRRLADSEGISLTGNLGILVALSHAILVMSLLALPLPICYFRLHFTR
jgi:predicted nucleic acid-binding protein